MFASTTASLYMYRQAFEFGLLSKGSAAGLILIIINIILEIFFHLNIDNIFYNIYYKLFN